MSSVNDHNSENAHGEGEAPAELLTQSGSGVSPLLGSEPRRLCHTPGASPSRARFMKLMAASMALAGLTASGCRRWPKEALAPYAGNPKNRTPGVSEQYATVMEIAGVAMPLLVSSYDGRPIKVEGNPSHPMSRITERYGAADAFAQASVLEMYDPQRSRVVIERHEGKADSRSWDAFWKFASAHFTAMRGGGGEMAVLCEATSSPSVLDMKRRLREVFPQCRWYEYEPISFDNESAGAKIALDKPLRSRLHLDQAAVVALFDADVLGAHPAHVRYAADWAQMRGKFDAKPDPAVHRMYVAESSFSITGAAADERLPVKPSRVESLLRALAAKLKVPVVESALELSSAETKFIDAIAKDIQANPGRAVVAAGWHLLPEAHAVAHAINASIGAIGKTVSLLPLDEPDRPTHAEAIAALAGEVKAGKVKTLLILGGNPAYDAPVDLRFSELLKGIPVSIHLSHFEDETSALCRWHLPRAHYLEAWGDGRAWDGTISVAQPLIEPLYDGKSIVELMSGIVGENLTGEQIVRRTMAPLLPKDADAERAWRRVLHDGLLANSAGATATPELRKGAIPPSKKRRQQACSSCDSCPPRVCGMAGSPTTAGSRNCPTR